MSGATGSTTGSLRKAEAVSRGPALWIATAISLLVAAWLFPEAWRHLRVDLEAGPARGAISRVSTPTPLTTDADWQEAIARLESAADIAPDSATAQAELGALYSAASLRADLPDNERLEYSLSASKRLEQATLLRPSDPRTWADLARARLLSGDAGPAYLHAWDMAAQLGPVEAIVQSQLYELVLATYPDPYTPAMAEWVRQLYATAKPYKRTAMAKVAEGFEVRIDDNGVLAAAPAASAASATFDTAAPEPSK